MLWPNPSKPCSQDFLYPNNSSHPHRMLTGWPGRMIFHKSMLGATNDTIVFSKFLGVVLYPCRFIAGLVCHFAPGYHT